MDNKLETISNLFEGKEIRSHWDSDEEEYYFSVVDVINALTNSRNPNDYWYRLKSIMSNEEKSEVSTKCRKLKLNSKDGKYRETDVLDTKGILRLIESVPSPKADVYFNEIKDEEIEWYVNNEKKFLNVVDLFH